MAAYKTTKSALDDALNLVRSGASNIASSFQRAAAPVAQKANNFYNSFSQGLKNYGTQQDAAARQRDTQVYNFAKNFIGNVKQASQEAPIVLKRGLQVAGGGAKAGLGNLGVQIGQMARNAPRPSGIPLADIYTSMTGRKILPGQELLKEKYPSLKIPGVEQAQALRTRGLAESQQAQRSLQQEVKPLDDNRSWGEKVTDPRWVSRGLLMNAPSLLSSLGLGAITGLVTRNPAAVSAVVFGSSVIQNTGDAYQDAMNNGADEESATGIASTVGGILGILDTVGIGKILERIPGGEALKSSLVKRVLKKTLESAFTEGTTESMQQIIQNEAARLYYDNNRGLLAGVPESLFFGSLMGGLGGAGAEMTNLPSAINPEEPVAPKEYGVPAQEPQFRQPNVLYDVPINQEDVPVIDDAIKYLESTRDIEDYMSPRYTKSQQTVRDMAANYIDRNFAKTAPIENVMQELKNRMEVDAADQYTPGLENNIGEKLDTTSNQTVEAIKQDLSQQLGSEAEQITPDVGQEMVDQALFRTGPMPREGFDISTKDAEGIVRGLFSEDEINFMTQGAKDIVTPEGDVAHGKYFDSIISVIEEGGKVESKTVYHEAFHAYADKFVDKELYNAAVSEKMAEAKITQKEAVEALAEDFADYASGKQQTFSGKIIEFFQNIISGVKRLLGMEDSKKLIYESILAKKRPAGGVQTATDQFRVGQNAPGSDQIVKKDPILNAKRDIPVTDIHGNKDVIPQGEALTPYELKGNKILLKDGKEIIVNKSQYQNVKNNSIKDEAKAFAPELEQTTETVKGNKFTSLAEVNKFRSEMTQKYGTTQSYEWPVEAQNELNRLTELADNPPEVAKYGQYTLPGGDNYREILIQAPEQKGTPPKIKSVFEASNGWRVQMEDGGLYTFPKAESAEEARKFAQDQINEGLIVNKSPSFTSSHWNEPNVLSHIRLDDRYIIPNMKTVTKIDPITGEKYEAYQAGNSSIPANSDPSVLVTFAEHNMPKVTFIEEIQSDWAREARARGIMQPEKAINELPEGYKVMEMGTDGDPLRPKQYRVVNPNGIQITATNYNREGAINEAINALNDQSGANKGVPGNPLLKNWQETALKRSLIDAVQNGSDYISWTTGDQQSARYNLSKQVDRIDWKPQGKLKIINIYPVETGKIELLVKDGKVLEVGGDANHMAQFSTWKGKDVSEVIGKGISEKIMARQDGVLSGEGLNIGGEWANNLYDKQIPIILEKLTGQKPEVLDLDLPVGKSDTPWGIEGVGEITKPEQMKPGQIILRGDRGDRRITDAATDQWIVTKVNSDGTFRAVQDLVADNEQPIYERILKRSMTENGDVPSITEVSLTPEDIHYLDTYAEKFELGIKKVSNQMGIKLTPEVKAKVLGKSPDLKQPSGAAPFEETKFRVIKPPPVPGTTKKKERAPGQLNVENLDLNKRQKKHVASIGADKILDTLTNEEVVRFAKDAGFNTKTYTTEQTKKIIAEELNTRRQVVELEKQADALKKKKAPLAQIAAVELQIAKVKSITESQGTHEARTLAARRILANEISTPRQKIYQLLNKAGVNPEAYAERAAEVDFNNVDEVINFYREFAPAGAEGWIDKIRYNSMLSSPTTHLVNMVSNWQGSAIITPVQKVSEGIVDGILSAVSGGRRERTRFAGEGLAYAKGFYSKLATQAIGNAIEALKKRGISEIPDNPQQIPLTGQGDMLHPVEQVLDSASKMLEAEDQFFVSLTKAGLEEAYKYRESKGVKVKNVADRIGEETEKILFRAPLKQPGEGIVSGALGAGGKWIGEATRSHNPIFRWIAKMSFPFVRVGTNLAKAGMEFNPITGALNLIGKEDKIEGVSNMLLGSGVILLGSAMAAAGKMTAYEPFEKNKKQAFRDAGMLPWAMKVQTPDGEKWIQFSKMHPLIGFQLGMVAAVNQAMEDGKLDEDNGQKIMNAFAGTMKYYMDQTYVKNLGDFSNIIGGDVDALSQLVSGYPQQLIPFRALGGFITRIIDQYQRKPDSDAGLFTKAFQTIASGIPGASFTVPERTDSLGIPVKQPDRLLNIFSPYKISSVNASAESTYNTMIDQSRLSKFATQQKKATERDLAKIIGGKAPTIKAPGGTEKLEETKKKNVDTLLESYDNAIDENQREKIKSHIESVYGIDFDNAYKDYLTKDLQISPKGLSKDAQGMLERSKEFSYVRKLRDKYDGTGLGGDLLKDAYGKHNLTEEDLIYDDKTLLPDDVQMSQIYDETAGLNGEDLLATLASMRRVSEGSRKPLLTDTLINKFEDDGYLTEGQADLLKRIGWDSKTGSFKMGAAKGSTKKSQYDYTSAKVPSVKFKTKPIGTGIGLGTKLMPSRGTTGAKKTSVRLPVNAYSPLENKSRIRIPNIRTPVRTLSGLGTL